MATTYDPTTAPIGELVAVPREKLAIDPNVRKDIGLDKSFVSNIRQYGIHQPPVGWRDEDGTVHITMGQRRTSAALEIGWPVVTVLVKPRDTAEGDAADERRMVAQLAENEQRLELSTADSAAAYRQLALFGLTEERIARKTNSAKGRVQTALKVAASPAALANAEAHSLTLDQAALIAEFDDDAEARTQLEQQAAKDPEQLEHAAARIREDRLDQAVIDRLAAEITAAGFKVFREYADRPQRAEYLSHLARKDDPDRAPLHEDDLASLDPEHVYGHIRPGNRGDADRGFGIEWYIDNWSAQGLTGRYSYSIAKPALTDEEKEAQREERRVKRQAKKDFQAATTLRREWISTVLLGRATRFTESHLAWIAGALLAAPGHLRDSRGGADRLAFELLGHPFDVASGWEYDAELAEHVYPDRLHAARLIKTDRATRVALAAAIARTELVVGNEKGDDFGRDRRAAKYLRTLHDWGYTLADVERAIVEAADARIETEAAHAEERDAK